MKHLHAGHSIETVSVRVSGKVQGVGFRAATVRQAHLLGIAGWVRNASDSSVEAVLQGSVDQIDRMLSWLSVGPPAARVDQVEHQQEFTIRHFDHFEQL
ncbi:MAG TPA: acylphosphatase [Burkholderiaceae bacterium]|nr:acylphosphatase [Burkholderiaceae bacterium]